MPSGTERQPNGSARRRTAGALAVCLAACLAAVGVACGGEKTYPTEGAPPAQTIPGGYTAGELTYFDEIALGGARPQWNPDTLVHKWRRDIRVAITGDVTAADTAFVDTLAAQVTAAIGGAVRVARDTAGPRNVEIVVWRPGTLLRTAEGEGSAFTGASLDAAGYIDSASTSLDGSLVGSMRRRVIRHEFMHALGFYDHAHVTTGTVMYLDTYSSFPEFTDLDLTVIAMLYRGEVTARMRRDDALAVLRTRLRGRP